MPQRLPREFESLFARLHRLPTLFQIYEEILPHEHVYGNGWVTRFSAPKPDVPLFVEVDKKGVDDKRLVYDAILTTMLPVMHSPAEDTKLTSSAYGTFASTWKELDRMGCDFPTIDTSKRNDLLYLDRDRIVHWSIIRPTPNTAQTMILEVRDTAQSRQLILDILLGTRDAADTGFI